jgi:ribosomal protein L3 glutamine methyltransferase
LSAERTLRALLAQAVRRFDAAGLAYGHGTTNALDEAAWMLLHALGLPPFELNAHLDEPIDEARYDAARKLIEQRVRTRKPAAYLLNEAWLGPHRFYVDERVIVPRSFIAEFLNKSPSPLGGTGAAPAKAGGRGEGPLRILDLCTGSGCLAILAALAFPQARVDAVDLSADALNVARRNVHDYGLQDRIELLRSDLFSALEGRTYDLIISNPPYVKAASMRTLPREYRREPEMALASGRDGLDHTRAILREAPRFLARDGLLVVEIGHNRKALERAYPKLAFRWPRTSGGPGYVFMLSARALEAGRGHMV